MDKLFNSRKTHLALLGFLAFLCTLSLAGSSLLQPYLAGKAAPPDPAAVVQKAWQRARELGSYRFITEIETTLTPPGQSASPKGARYERLSIEGQADLPANKLDMTLWEKGGQAFGTRQGIQIRVEGDKTYSRVGNGAWQEMGGSGDAFSSTDAFAPGQDPMAFLAGAKDFILLGAESAQVPASDGLHQLVYTRYGFRLDGVAFAAYMRDQLEKRLTKAGQLPPGITIDVPEAFRSLSGQGEIWIDEAGLPLRLVLDLDYPALYGEQSQSHVKTDFSGFPDETANAISGLQRISLWARSSFGWPTTTEGWDSWWVRLGLLTGFLALALVAVIRARSRLFQAALAVVVILSMLLSPLLESQRALAAVQWLEARNQQAQEQQEVTRLQAVQQSAQASPDWDAQQSPLAVDIPSDHDPSSTDAAPIVPARPLMSLGETQQVEAVAVNTIELNSDLDNDRLTYQEEMRLGTDPTLLNSDLDGLGDGLEALGFVYAGTRYYTNPLSSDTIGDGLVDTIECWTTPPALLPDNTTGCNQDTDADGHLDIFERDNDNDGVPDSVDLSPFSSKSGYSDANPFLLVVNNLEPLPVLVDLQIRPTNPEHLVYTLSVLDWPTGDTQGQVQRVLDTTFATAVEDPLTPEEIEADPSSQYGDMRLIPMLEISVPYKEGHTRNLPVKPGFSGPLTATTPLDDWLDTGKLAKYGMAAHYLDEDGTLGIYVPLSLVADETGGNDVAFLAHFYYEPQANGDWGNAHQMRVVWWVEMLTDACDSDTYDNLPPDVKEATDFAAWCANPDNRIESIQIVHAYPEDWSLAGIAVREDHGLEAAIAFEDADSDSDVNLDTSLWQLAEGLDSAFLTGRDQDGDGNRDITVREIERRWDNLTNAGNGIPNGDDRLWGIDKSALQVWMKTKEDLPHIDYQITLVMTTTQEILNSKFLPTSGCVQNCNTPRAVAPTLLYATEASARTANLDMGGTTIGEGLGGALIVDMNPEVLSVGTVASLYWIPYRYGVNGWEVYPLEEYVDLFTNNMQVYFPANYPDPLSEEELADMVLWATCFYLGLTEGIAIIVQLDEELVDGEGNELLDDANIAVPSIIESIYRICDSINAAISTKELFHLIVPMEFEMRELGGGGEAVDDALPHYAGSLSERIMAGVKTGICIAMAVTSAIFALLAFTVDSPALPFIQAGLMLTGSVFLVGFSIAGLVKSFGTGLMKSIGHELKGFTHKAGFKLAIIGAAFDILAQVGLFIANVVVGDVNPASIAFDAMLAGLFAGVIVTVLLAVIYAIPIVGDVIYAIVSAINFIFEIVCSALGEDFEESKAGSWICGGITGILTRVMSWLIFSTKPILDVEYEDGLKTAPPQVSLERPGQGFQVDNALGYTIVMTETIRQTSLKQLDNWKQIEWFWQFNEKNLKKTTFDYSLTPEEEDLDGDLYLGKETDWQNIGTISGVPYEQITEPVVTEVKIPLTTSGINQSFPTYFNQGYALPVQECWGWPIPPISGCGIKAEKGSAHSEIGQYFLFDVFPASLDGFRTLQAAPGGQRLSWGGSLAFPVLLDADADGLSSASDPNDAAWDSDHDGLSDPFEKQIGTDPKDGDSDDDSLADRDELLHGANPKSQDSDHDGLSDAIEVNGWEFVFGWVDAHTPKIMWVTSDPQLYDTDFDGLSDRQEWLYGWNPLAVSEGNVLTFSSELSEKDASGVYTPTDGIVKAGDQLHYQADVRNELDLRYMRGLLGAVYPASALSGSVVPKTFVLAPHEPATIQGDFGVQAGNSGPITLTQIAGAELYDAHAASNYALLLLHLEEAEDATVFLDESGGVERHNGTCSAGACPQRQAGGILGKGLHFTDYGQEINVPGVDLSRGSFGVTLWMRTSSSYVFLLASTNNNVTLYLNNNGQACGYVRTSSGKVEVCSDNPINDGNFHHLAFNYDEKTSHLLEIYVDGVLAKTAALTSRSIGQPGLGLGYYYIGDLDEVTVYDKALTATEIYETASVQIFLHARLDEPAGATVFPVTGQGMEGECFSPGCPTLGSKGVARSAASFNGQQFIGFGYDDDHPYTFTVSAWINPQQTGNTTIDQHWQGVIGGQGLACAFAGTNLHNCSFPSIEWKAEGACLRSEFGDAGISTSYQIDPVCGVAPAGSWSQVTVTFRQASVTEPGYYILYVNGTPKAEKILAPKSTLYQAWGGIIFYAGCSWSNTGGNVECPVDYNASTIPFHGSIDEVRVYKQGLTQAEVQDLYAEDARPLYLHMDDAPGAYLVENANGQEPASCPSNLVGCPTSGVAGRMNQGSYFTSTEKDGLSSPTSLDLSTNTPGATLMAWIYPTSGGDTSQLVLGSEDGNTTTKEWRLYRDQGKWAVENGYAYWGTNVPIELDRWQHIAVVFNPASGTTKVYKNCSASATDTYTNLGYPAHSNHILVGCDPTKPACFQGRLDEVQVHSRALTDSEVQAACGLAPQLTLHLDEGLGQAKFIDDTQNGHSASCLGEACPKAGADGQVGLAAEFDGLDDGLDTNYGLSSQEATIMVWARPGSTSNLTQALIGASGSDQFELYHKDGLWQLRMASGAVLAPAGAVVQPEQWQHLAVVISLKNSTYHATLYLNGSQMPGGLDLGGYSLLNAGIGFQPALHDHHFDGRIDEVAAYGRAMSPTEILQIYAYQAGWVEEVQPTGLVVDNLAPVTRLVLNSTIIANQPTQLLIETYDATTAVTQAQWRLNAGAWVDAPPCEGKDTGSAWCPVLTPNGAGSYLVEARATDRAGNLSNIASATLVVDITAPTATLAQDGQLVPLQPDAYRANAWTAALSGTVSDGGSGSGVASLRVALFDALGAAVSGDSQLASVNGSSWSISYQLSEPLITGSYTVQLEVADRLDNHSQDPNHTIALDITPPEPSLDGLPPGGTLAFWRLEEPSGATRFADSSGMGNDAVCAASCPLAGNTGQYGHGVKLTGGASLKSSRELTVSDPGFSLSAWFLTSLASQQTLFAATDSTGAKVFTVKLDSSGKVQFTYSPPGANPSSISTKKTFKDNTWHHLSAQWHPGQIRLYLDGQLVRTVGSVEGVPPSTVNVIVGVDNGIDPFVGAVDEVAIHGVWLTPAEVRSLAYTDPSKLHNQIPLQGTLAEVVSSPDALLALHLEEAASPFADSTAYDNNATCTSPACPTTDSSGSYGAALRFDGVDDGLTIPSTSLNYLTNDLTVMAWIKPERLTGVQRVLSLAQCSSGGGFGFGLSWSSLNFTPYGIDNHSSGSMLVSLNQWQHIAAVVDADTSLTFYINGVAVYTAPGQFAPTANCLGDIQVGRSITAAGVATDRFQGAIDEVQVFNRALTPEEILAQGHRYNAGLSALQVAYTPDLGGSTMYNTTLPEGTQLYLPYDDSVSPTGTPAFLDISGKGHHGSCSEPACPSSGQVGHAGSSLAFDGIDDFVNFGNFSAGDLSGDFTVGGWFTIEKLVWWMTPIAKGAWSANGAWSVLVYTDPANLNHQIRLYMNGLEVARIYSPSGGWQTGEWYHFAFSRTGSTIQTFLNGVLKSSYSSSAVTGNSEPVLSGKNVYRYFWQGSLDELILLNRGLTAAELSALYLGTGPVVHLPLDDAWMLAGERLVDNSGWERNATLYAGSDDAANKRTPGQVGSGALRLDGANDYASLGDVNETDGLADFALSQWFYLDALSPITIGWASLLGKGAWNGSDGWAVLVENVSAAPDKHKVNLYFNGAIVATLPAPSGGWQVGRWYHYVFTRNGSVIKGYLDGSEKVSSSSDVIPVANTASLLLGMDQAGKYLWQGKLDDLQIFRRAISPDEVQALYNTRWQAASLAASGSTVMFSNWSTSLPAGLEGHYQLELRGWDRFDNQTTRRSTWDGMLDTKAPRLTLTYEGGPTTYTYRFSAQDWNLDPSSLQSPCPASTSLTSTYFNAPWYRALTGVTTPDSSRLYTLSASCSVTTNTPSQASLKACDLYGNCANFTAAAPLSLLEAKTPPPAGQVLVLEPAPGAIVSSALPVVLSGLATSDKSLKWLTVRVDGRKVLDQRWIKGSTQSYNWSANWTPTFAGTHRVQANLTDWSNVKSEHSVTFTLDTQPPNLSITTSVLTSTHVVNGQLPIAGSVTDANGVAGVEVRLQAEGYGSDWTPAALDGASWQALVFPGSGYQPDGQSLQVEARAMDRAGWTQTTSRMVTADLQPPVAVDLEITWSDGNLTQPITRTGTLISNPAPALVLRWPASRDGSGISGYQAGWTVQDANGTAEILSTYGPSDERIAAYQAGEAQRLTASLVSRDQYGNRQVQSFGPIYADSPLTPDIIALDQAGETYRGWMENGCSLLGVDRRSNRRSASNSTRNQDQALYATWDQSALRLAWKGANWSGDGDLFIYLDTQPGGTLDALNPYTTPTALLQLPGVTPLGLAVDPMYADYIVWVLDNQTTWLYHWDGAAWVALAQLSQDQYRFTPGLDGGLTDLYLPFDLLGITDPQNSPLKLVAMASEEGELQLWAVLPQSNPITSSYVTGMPRIEQTWARFALNHPYRWQGLSSGFCPNGSQAAVADQRHYTNDDLQWSVTVDPAGAAYRYLGDNLFGWWLQLLGDKPEEFSSLLSRIASEHPRLQDGQEIIYTINYKNEGPETAEDVVLQARGRLALILPDGVSLEPDEHIYYQEVPVGDVAPGQTGVITLRGRVDLDWAEVSYKNCLGEHPATPLACEFNQRWALLGLRVYDQAHTPQDGPREWMWVDHRVDSQAPVFSGIQSTAFGLSAVTPNTIRGYTYDESGVPLIRLEIMAPDGAIRQQDCFDSTPRDGEWNCNLDLLRSQDGELYQVRLQAVDGAGQVSDWSQWRTFAVDLSAPEITVSDVPTDTLGGPPLSLNSLDLAGQVLDNYGVDRVEVCLDDRCSSATTQFPAQEWSSSDLPASPLTIGACGGGELVRSFTLSANYPVADVRLGFQAEVDNRSRLSLTLISPEGTIWQGVGDDYDASTDHPNLNVILSDRAKGRLQSLRAGQALTAGGFALDVRPLQPLAVFRNQAAGGTWRLSACLNDDEGGPGLYRGAKLWVDPLNTAPLNGDWQFSQQLEPLDDVVKIVQVFGIDQAGNRSSPPQLLSFRVDNVSPVLTVAQLFSPVIIQPDLAPVMVMVGSISDGGKVKRMHAFIRDPEGQGLSVRPLVEEGLTWSLSFQPMVAGMYQVWIAAEDEAGNLTVAGPFTVEAESIPVVESVPAMTFPTVIPTETPWLIGTPTPTFTETPTPLWIDTPTPAPSLTDMPLPTLTETPVPTPTWTVTPTPMAESP